MIRGGLLDLRGGGWAVTKKNRARQTSRNHAKVRPPRTNIGIGQTKSCSPKATKNKNPVNCKRYTDHLISLNVINIYIYIIEYMLFTIGNIKTGNS